MRLHLHFYKPLLVQLAPLSKYHPNFLPLRAHPHPPAMTEPAAEHVIVTLTGKQSPSALSQAMRVLGDDPSLQLADFAQLVVRDRFIATALLRIPAARDVIKDLLFRAHEDHLTVDFTVAPSAAPPPALAARTPDEYVVTLFAPGTISPTFLATALAALVERDCKVRGVTRLTEQGDDFMCLELRIAVPAGDGHVAALQKELFELGRQENQCDVALQKANVLRKAKRMVVFDLSWTLVQCDAIDVLLQAAGKSPPPEVEAAFRQGNLSGPEWLKARAKQLEGVDAGKVNAAVVHNLTYTHGAVELCKGLKRLGCRLAVVSSGSKFIAERAKDHLGLDYAFGNLLETDSANKFSGLVIGPIIDTERKAELTHMLAMQERIDMEQIVAVGDGPVSSKMLAAAGMSVAFDQPDATDEIQSGRIASKSLASVLYLLGVTGHDFRRMTEGY
ncbi:unnamed protein product [Chondrus crispus]|uniref:phosphoserine phosphatase n=1 Tax=Chondrus crispus TaxID=2769 RepID=R7QHG2_CHOCR|nr:unnamed protein product [Chondrus crispus]CDF37208.1 unnamed protein product [Chondrus crispus]|eukprot:XP_005717027.1 unnamed protein product [Chondrus crispus]